MKILLLGAHGQLGSQLRGALPAAGEVTACSRADADVTDAGAMRRAIREGRPDIVVNAAAFTAVDRADHEPEAAFAANALACETIAREAHGIGAWLVHYSTDYVFDGRGSRPWREDDATGPLGVYGASKLAGESAIRAVCERHVILRTSWVYEAGHDNFVGAILKAACAHDELAVVDDQWGAPTRARTIAQATARLLKALQPHHAGLYHLVSGGETNRHAFAQEILKCASACGWPLRAGSAQVKAVPTSPAPGTARRPLNSRLDGGLFARTFGFAPGPWRADLEAAIGEWPMMPRS